MLTLAGAIEAAADGSFRNTLFALRDGGLVHVHRKVHLATYGRLDDGAWFVPGERIETFAFAPNATKAGADDTWRIAPMICADTWNPPLVHLAAAQGASLMAVAVSSALEAVGDGFDNPAGWDVNLRFHALTYGLPIVMANRVGSEDGLTFWGGSRILDASGNVVASALPGDGETLVTASVGLRDGERARTRLPTMRDADATLLAREFARILPGT
jgi:predicted amidohydrolase